MVINRLPFLITLADSDVLDVSFSADIYIPDQREVVFFKARTGSPKIQVGGDGTIATTTPALTSDDGFVPMTVFRGQVVVYVQGEAGNEILVTA